jgi:hypothetical protein
MFVARIKTFIEYSMLGKRAYRYLQYVDAPGRENDLLHSDDNLKLL